MMQPYLTRTYCISIVMYLAFMQRLRSRLLQAAASLSFGWREMMSMQIRLGGESTGSSFKSRSNSVIQTRRCCALDNAGGGRRRRDSRIRAALLRSLTAGFGTSRTSADVRLESAKWGKADIYQVAVTNRDL